MDISFWLFKFYKFYSNIFKTFLSIKSKKSRVFDFRSDDVTLDVVDGELPSLMKEWSNQTAFRFGSSAPSSSSTSVRSESNNRKFGKINGIIIIILWQFYILLSFSFTAKKFFNDYLTSKFIFHSVFDSIC